MTDRELLELAAKAAGVGPLDFDYPARDKHGLYCGPRLPMPQGVIMAAMHNYWNPLTDDGDALRLAVKLRIGIKYDDELAICTANNQVESFWNRQSDAEATRRAIVRAAAVIGKTMK